MYLLKENSLLTIDEYLAAEAQSEIKHEYIGGQVYAMSGASRNHNLIALNIATSIRTHLRGSDCRGFISDMKVKIESKIANLFYYPDVVVTCNSQDNQKFFLTEPCLAIEVLSPSTESIDRREKWLEYQNLSSLQEYVLVSQSEMKVEIYRRDDTGKWSIKTLVENDSLELRSIDLTIPTSLIYEDVYN
jgi:Uma2 family endonuclease